MSDAYSNSNNNGSSGGNISGGCSSSALVAVHCLPSSYLQRQPTPPHTHKLPLLPIPLLANVHILLPVTLHTDTAMHMLRVGNGSGNKITSGGIRSWLGAEKDNSCCPRQRPPPQIAIHTLGLSMVLLLPATPATPPLRLPIVTHIHLLDVHNGNSISGSGGGDGSGSAPSGATHPAARVWRKRNPHQEHTPLLTNTMDPLIGALLVTTAHNSSAMRQQHQHTDTSTHARNVCNATFSSTCSEYQSSSSSSRQYHGLCTSGDVPTCGRQQHQWQHTSDTHDCTIDAMLRQCLQQHQWCNQDGHLNWQQVPPRPEWLQQWRQMFPNYLLRPRCRPQSIKSA